jgi:uncharacterized protein YciI
VFVIRLNYIKPLAEIDRLLEAHRQFLNAHYASGDFVLSGRLEPRTGGLILARVSSRPALEAILADDPFRQAEAATYDLIEFVPTAAAPGLAAYLLSNR